jgi:Transposase
MINQPLSTKTIARQLKKTRMKAVVKKKRPLLTKRHRQEWLDWALAHKDWTVEDWKRVIIMDCQLELVERESLRDQPKGNPKG